MTSLRRRRRGSVLIKRTSIWSSSLHLGSISVPAWQSDHQSPNIMSATCWISIFSRSLITNLDSLVGFYRADEPGFTIWISAPAIIHHDQAVSVLLPFLHPPSLITILTSGSTRSAFSSANVMTSTATRVLMEPRSISTSPPVKKRFDNEAFLFRILKLINGFNWNFRNVLFRSKKKHLK